MKSISLHVHVVTMHWANFKEWTRALVLMGLELIIINDVRYFDPKHLVCLL